eukprot:CAMPEP_0183505466 /NCGR_PEP_ID=MMETSP0371-20130417/6707_1 /TAXON_ID=268820 /ORGANISM="Peridinium aciculiferum, Strain PAER-2" /LENGTH=466 /DNA_ID=CAMNT_0025701165 /DNA_START=61 /DNA_END=1461 /DNA_ORIENTATION=+
MPQFWQLIWLVGLGTAAILASLWKCQDTPTVVQLLEGLDVDHCEQEGCQSCVDTNALKRERCTAADAGGLKTQALYTKVGFVSSDQDCADKCAAQQTCTAWMRQVGGNRECFLYVTARDIDTNTWGLTHRFGTCLRTGGRCQTCAKEFILSRNRCLPRCSCHLCQHDILDERDLHNLSAQIRPPDLITLEETWDPIDVSSLACALWSSRNTIDAWVGMVIFDMHTLCMLDNYINNILQIQGWRYPIVAVGIGSDEILEVCNRIARFAAKQVVLHCLRTRTFPMAIPENQSGKALSSDYHQIGHLKTDLMEFSTRLGVRVFFTDTDNVFVSEPSGVFAHYLESTQIVTPTDRGYGGEKLVGMHNLGLVLATPAAHPQIRQWMNKLQRSGPESWDQGTFNTLFQGEGNDSFLPDYQFDKSGLQKEGHPVFAIHCYWIVDKIGCLKQLSLWKPSGVKLHKYGCMYDGQW